MNTLHLSPRARVSMPEALRWVVVGLSFLLATVAWWASDLWRIFTWDKAQLEMGGAMPVHKQLTLAFLGFALALCMAIVTWLAYTHSWYLYEWVMLIFPFGFFYCVFSYIKLAY